MSLEHLQALYLLLQDHLQGRHEDAVHAAYKVPLLSVSFSRYGRSRLEEPEGGGDASALNCCVRFSANTVRVTCESLYCNEQQESVERVLGLLSGGSLPSKAI